MNNNGAGVIGFMRCVCDGEKETGNEFACQGVNNILSCVTD